jgi:serine/threonine protein kinase
LQVFQVVKKDTHAIYAMKVLRKEFLLQTNNVQYTLTERNILRNIRHPFLTSLHYAFQTAGKVYLVMDFMNGGQLLHHMRKQVGLLQIRASETVRDSEDSEGQRVSVSASMYLSSTKRANRYREYSARMLRASMLPRWCWQSSIYTTKR